MDMNFISKTENNIDLNLALTEYINIIEAQNWPKKYDSEGNTLSSNQIGLNYRPGASDQWLDNTGSLYNSSLQQFDAKEKDFTEFNIENAPYTIKFIKNLAKKIGFKIGRVRYMRLQEKTGLTVHQDLEQRYHIALITHPSAFFGEVIDHNEYSAKCYHIPADGYVYKVDTRRKHFVYNGGRQDRVHIVISEA